MEFLNIEGGLLSEDILKKIIDGSIYGQSPKDFGVKRFTDEVASVWNLARELWSKFQKRSETLKEEDTGTTITRNLWIVPLLTELGYNPIYEPQAAEISGVRYNFSHRMDIDSDSPPLHIVGFRQDLDKKAPNSRFSPHATIQQYLNVSDHLWGMVINGYKLRIVRATAKLTIPAYIEFDLKWIMEAEDFSAFIVFYRLAHRSRFPKGISDAHECLLEKYYQESLEQGTRIRDRLRDSVEEALKILGNGFLNHLLNTRLREAVSSGNVSPHRYYRELLRLIYCLLFVMVAEERRLIQPGNPTLKEIYDAGYGLSRIRELSRNPRIAQGEHYDLWEGVKRLILLLSSEEGEKLGLTILDGGLFSWEEFFFKDLFLSNRDLLEAVHHLSYFEKDGRLTRVNYAALDVEELGSVYESLLDYQPVFADESSKKVFKLEAGTERKSTGSYYTPSSLVQELIKSALEPVLEERIKKAKTKEEKEKAILSIKVCDPACGSGHFLLAAARRLGYELARVKSGEEHPSVDEIRHAKREVIQHCLYGVDKNPLAVDLCKVALWLEGACKGEPLTFLDHHIKCGDSLVGVFDLNVLADGIPDDAYKPLEMDDKSLCRELKNRNKHYKNYGSLFRSSISKSLSNLIEEFKEFEMLSDESLEDLKFKSEYYRDLRESEVYKKLEQACNIWTAAFFIEKTEKNKDIIPTSDEFFSFFEQPEEVSPELLEHVSEISEKLRFFHWPLEFPDVFEKGGFDVVLGNPPWKKIKLQEKEFFAIRAPEIANAANRAVRQRLIKKLKEENSKLYREFLEAKHYADATSLFLRASGRFPLTARGDINTYSVFAELALRLIGPKGNIGIIVPTDIATVDTNKVFFQYLILNQRLVSLYDFENRLGIFQSVEKNERFCLLTLTNRKCQKFTIAAHLDQIDSLKVPYKKYSISIEEIKLINPNTKNCPVFKTSFDAQLIKKIYRRVPVLVNERTGENPWGVRFFTMFHMSNDSHLFHALEELQDEGYELKGNRFFKNNKEYFLPLYEAKLIHQFNHRAATFEGIPRLSRFRTHAGTKALGKKQLENPQYLTIPRYWVKFQDVVDKSIDQKWYLGFRNAISATADTRSFIAALVPLAAVGNSLPAIISTITTKQFAISASVLLGLMNSIVLDFVLKQKSSSSNMNFYIVKQLPFLPPEAFSEEDILFIIPRVLELVYTSWDIKCYADEIWEEANNKLKKAIKLQWQKNKEHTGGHNWMLPAWIEAYPEIQRNLEIGIPLPPFKWNDKRRAVLCAELDAYIAKLYGLTEEELRYILDPQDVFGPDFPSETFRVLKEKEIRQFGEYRTKRLVLEAWKKIEKQIFWE